MHNFGCHRYDLFLRDGIRDLFRQALPLHLCLADLHEYLGKHVPGVGQLVGLRHFRELHGSADEDVIRDEAFP